MKTEEIDGVPALLAPTNGPTRAGLTFRVGQADETLANRGITHLVEHLALYRHGATALHYNGATAANVTHFVIEGGPGEIVKYFEGVCSSLADLPMDRLETEKAILRTEAASRSRSPLSQMALWRHGARDFGLTSYPEFGLRRITSDNVASWSADWFTRGNAVFWMAGEEIPTDLRLTLPDGVRKPSPAPSSALPATPAYFWGGNGAIGASMVVDRGTRALMYSRVLQRELFRSLRHESGLSYVTQTKYELRSAELADVYALVDVAPDKLTETVQAFLSVLSDMAERGVDETELATAVSAYEERLRQADTPARRLPALASNILLGRTPQSVDDLVCELQDVSVAGLVQTAQAAHASALVMVPGGQQLEWAGYERAPVASRFAVTGRTFQSRNDHTLHLIVGSDGVSTVRPEGAATVLYDDCVALLQFPDGARKLIGGDAIAVDVEPTLFGIDSATVAGIDVAVNSDVTIRMDERSADERPAVTRASRRRAYLRRLDTLRKRAKIRYRNRSRLPRIKWALIGLVVAAIAMIGFVILAAASRNPTETTAAAALAMWVLRYIVVVNRRRRR